MCEQAALAAGHWSKTKYSQIDFKWGRVNGLKVKCKWIQLLHRN